MTIVFLRIYDFLFGDFKIKKAGKIRALQVLIKNKR